MKSNVLPDLEPFLVPIDNLKLLPGNPRRGSVKAVRKSLVEFGQHKPLVARRVEADEGTVIGEVLIGNHTLMAARELGWDDVAVIWSDDPDAKALARSLADNRVSDLGAYDNDDLAAMMQSVLDADEQLLNAASYTQSDLDALLNESTSETGQDADEEVPDPHLKSNLNLFDRFMVPPFSVLDARGGWWQDRKRAWIALGIEGELGRDDKPHTWYIAEPGSYTGELMVDEHAADERRSE